MGKPPTKMWTRDQVAAGILAGDTLVVLRNELIRIPKSWLTAHPGGALNILHFVGRDATDEINAFHSDETLAAMKHYIIGTVETDEDGVWKPLVPPLMSGWVRKMRADGKQEWYNEASPVRSEQDADLSTASEILLVERTNPPTQCGPDISTLEPPPTALTLKLQAQHSAAYKALHERVIDAGLYNTRYVAGYGPEVLRYTIFAVVSAIAYKNNWLVVSAVFLGFLWHQLVFTVHDLGHVGVTHNWTIDRVIAIFCADFIGGLSVGWWVDNHNTHHLVTNHPIHDPDIQHLPFFANTTVFFKSVWSSYYKRVLPFDGFSRFFVSIQHKIFYFIMSLARFNLYRLSYTFLAKNAFPSKHAKGGRWWWWSEIVCLGLFWCWYSAVLRGCGSWPKALMFVMITNMIPSPLHVQIVLSHYSRSTADLGPYESFAARQLRTTADVICPPSLAFLHGGLHLQITHHLFPRLPRHNLLEASLLVKEFAKEQDLEFVEFGFVAGNGEVRGVLKQVADQVKIIGIVADAEVREAVAAEKLAM